MLVALVYNKITTFCVIVPIIWGLLNYKSIKTARTIFALLIISFITETTSYISFHIFEYNLYKIGLIYTILEISFLSYFYLESTAFKHKIYIVTANILISLYLLLTYIFNLGGLDIPYALTSIYEIILVSIYILSNTKNILDNWRFTVFFAFFQYNLLAIGVFTMIDYIEKHQEYVSYYQVLHSTANLLLYILITIGLFQCKKHFLKVSSL